MNIHDVCLLSGLTRGQINQLISRWRVTPHYQKSVAAGSARRFTSADVFNFCIAGRATAIGLDGPTIRDIVASLPIPRVDPDTFEQIEIFPGYRADRNMVLVVAKDKDGFCSSFVSASKSSTVMDGGTKIVFEASKIAREIAEYDAAVRSR